VSRAVLPFYPALYAKLLIERVEFLTNTPCHHQCNLTRMLGSRFLPLSTESWCKMSAPGSPADDAACNLVM
jgi:hypothetical protein